MPFIHSKKHFRHLGSLLQKAHECKMLSLYFQFIYERDYETILYYSSYVIMYENVSLTFRLVLVDASFTSGPRPCISFAMFVLENVKILSFLNYTIVCVHLDTHTIL